MLFFWFYQHFCWKTLRNSVEMLHNLYSMFLLRKAFCNTDFRKNMLTEKSEQHPRTLLLKLNYGASIVTTVNAPAEALPHLNNLTQQDVSFPWPLSHPLTKNNGQGPFESSKKSFGSSRTVHLQAGLMARER